MSHLLVTFAVFQTLTPEAWLLHLVTFAVFQTLTPDAWLLHAQPQPQHGTWKVGRARSVALTLLLIGVVPQGRITTTRKNYLARHRFCKGRRNLYVSPCPALDIWYTICYFNRTKFGVELKIGQ
jgi:hypothetical protein